MSYAHKNVNREIPPSSNLSNMPITKIKINCAKFTISNSIVTIKPRNSQLFDLLAANVCSAKISALKDNERVSCFIGHSLLNMTTTMFIIF